VSPRSSLRTAGPALLLGVLAFVLTVDVRAQHQATRASAGRRAELTKLVEAREAHAAELDARLADLRKQLTGLTEASGQARIQQMRALSDQIAGLSGAVAVQGPGVVVTLSDAGNADRTSNDPDSRIQDVDLQAVVNALWAAGAEGIAVNGQRLVSTSAIRDAGAAVLVNFRVLSSPYRVQAVGDADGLRTSFARSDISRRFKGWTEIYGLGFEVERRGTIDLPAYQGNVHFRYATPIERGVS
jgi:uncharacterized protein YlxW (UPF0749 family)